MPKRVRIDKEREKEREHESEREGDRQTDRHRESHLVAKMSSGPFERVKSGVYSNAHAWNASDSRAHRKGKKEHLYCHQCHVSTHGMSVVVGRTEKERKSTRTVISAT